MSSFVIKIIAIISMLIDHSGDALIGYSTPLNFIGRIAFPLFCFQLVNGYAHTHDVKKYCLRLGLFALISQIPFGIMIYNYSGSKLALNVFFTLLFGLITLIVYDNKKLHIIYKCLIITCILLIAHFINVDYQALGIILILVIHIFYKRGIFNSKEFLVENSNTTEKIGFVKNLNNSTTTANITKHSVFYNKLFFALVMLVFSILRYLPVVGYFSFDYVFCFILCTFLPTFIMLMYNGKKGYSLKYFFYIFYPAHLIVLNILHSIIF